MLKKILLRCGAIFAVLSLGACATSRPATSANSDWRENVRNLAWASYGVGVECALRCAYSAEELKSIAQTIANQTFPILDEKLRKTVGVPLEPIAQTIGAPDYSNTIAAEAPYGAVKVLVGQIGHTGPIVARAGARGMKWIDPDSFGWPGPESIAALGRKLDVEGMLVGYVRVVADSSEVDEFPPEKKLTVFGPKLWIYSTESAQAVAMNEPMKPVLFEGDSEEFDWNALIENTKAREFSPRPR
jgi:hypothetical protein